MTRRGVWQSPRGWRHGDPVSYPAADGSVMAIGKAIIRTSLTTRKPYLKVQVQTVGSGVGRIGEWVWPDGWVIGQGAQAGTCLSCEQPFRTDAADPSGFCPPCDRRFAEQTKADSGIRKPNAYLRGARTPTPRVQPASNEEIAAQQAADEQERPF